jgi:hypothetical protein
MRKIKREKRGNDTIFAIMNKICSNRKRFSPPMANRSDRINYIFTIIIWVVLLSMVILFYSELDKISLWTPAWRSLMNTIYLSITYVLSLSLIVSITNLIFREIRHSDVMSNIVIRRFLPIVRFLITATIWIVGFFYLLEEFHINTNNILA